MDAISYTTARANLASTMGRVCNDHLPLIITRNGKQSVVMLSLEDYNALEETAYLLRSPVNAKRVLAATAQLNAGEGVERKLSPCNLSLLMRLGRTPSTGKSKINAWLSELTNSFVRHNVNPLLA